MHLIFDLIAALLFIVSTGVLFNERYRKNYFLVGIAGLFATASTLVLFKDSRELFGLHQPPKHANTDHPSSALEPDEASWLAIKDSKLPTSFDEFLKRFPASPHAKEARAKLDELGSAKGSLPTAPPPPEISSIAPMIEVRPRADMPLASTEEQSLRAGYPFKECDSCPEMVVVPAGTFIMGSPANEDGRNYDEGPQHKVTILRSFAIGRFPVTFDEWDACVANGGCKRPNVGSSAITFDHEWATCARNGDCFGYRPPDQGWGRSRRPVINVSWKDTKSYAVWLSRKTGKEYRLLTEAEFEYAARARTTTQHWWGPTAPQTPIEEKGALRQKTSLVDMFTANPWGIYITPPNLAGLKEWVEDCKANSYLGAPVDGSAWRHCLAEELGIVRVVRSGLRSAWRSGYYADMFGPDLTFRVARNLARNQ